MSDWNFQARAHACQGCGRPFTDRQAYHTLLFEERHGYARLDVCGDCWSAQHGHGATDRKGQGILERKVSPQDLAATVFAHLGIDPESHWINGQGRPIPIVVEGGRPIGELWGS